MGTVPTTGAAIDVWHAILVEADKSEPSIIPNIIAIVAREYPRHAAELDRIHRRYLELMGPDRQQEYDDDLFLDFSHAQSSWRHNRKQLDENYTLIQKMARKKRWNVRHIQDARDFDKLPVQAALLFACPRHEELKPAEIKGLDDWVRAGGRLLALGFYSIPHHRTNIGQLMNLFGFCFQHNVLLPFGSVPADALHQAVKMGERYVVRVDTSKMSTSDPLLKGVEVLGLQSACSLKVYNAEPQEVDIVLHSGTEPLIWEPKNIRFDKYGQYWERTKYVPSTKKERPLIVKTKVQHGRVVAIGTWKVFCDNFIDDDTLGNCQLFGNTLDWFRE